MTKRKPGGPGRKHPSELRAPFSTYLRPGDRELLLWMREQTGHELATLTRKAIADLHTEMEPLMRRRSHGQDKNDREPGGTPEGGGTEVDTG